MQSLRSRANIEKKRQKRKKMLFVGPAVVVILFGLFFYYAFAARFHVTNVIVSGSSFAKADEVKASVNEILSEKLWGFIPQKSSLLIGEKYIENALHEKHPAIKTVSVDVQGNAVFIKIEERTATAVICTASNACYFLDATGFAFAAAPQFEGSSFIKIRTFDTQIKTGMQVISKAELDKIVGEMVVFKALGISIKLISITSENEMRLIDMYDTEFIVRREDGANLIEERLRAVIGSRPDIANGMYEYIDLRIDSKIFLKSRES
jgi:cell division septal protein FtsQ